MSEPHEIRKPSELDLYRENQRLAMKLVAMKLAEAVSERRSLEVREQDTVAKLAAARREAEETLAAWDSPRHDFAAPGYANLRYSDAVDCVIALRSLLAATTPAPSSPPPPERDWRNRALDGELALRVLLNRQRNGKPLDLEKYAHIAMRSASVLRADIEGDPDNQAPPPPASGCINGRCDRPETHYHRKADDAGYGVICMGDEITAAFDRLRPPPPTSEAVIKAAERVSRIYFEIAAEAVGEEHVRAEFKRRHRAELDALAATGAGEEGEK